MKRILLFLATNLAVIAVASITLNILGVGSYITAQGLNMSSLLVFCAVFGFAGSFVSLFLSKMMAKMGTGTQIIDQPRTAQERWLIDTVQELSEKAGIGMPEVGIFPSPESNAFATGWNKNASLVAVSQGLLDRFSPKEARAVIGHEIGHVANGDMVTLALIQGVVNTFVMFFARIIGYAVDSFLRRDEESSGPGIGFYVVSFIAEIILGIAASSIVMWFSRKREFRADEAGAELAGRGDMIAALERLRAEYDAPSVMPATMTAFGIRKNGQGGLAALFSSHPALEDRIQALQAHR
ncbi:protease HtpX [Endozoicomonas numazuensis]|uniref:Protease HtpX n=1 Tax=Endozoicomonas numazuensis TaxID=1137799 RepID=A0A081NG28_9GAMM|nr:protease HtpX [Endozoicomonas numazuensis]KEQ17401.1 protease HtpX [Endozoicomonas numazuensis]